MALKNSRRPVAVVDPGEPRLGFVWVLLLYVVAVLALVHPALGGAFLVNPMSDQLNGTAYRLFGQQYLAQHGGFPHWNPFILGGMPYLAAQGVGDIFYPTFLARMVASADVVLTWSFAVHLLLAGLFTWGFLRAWGIGYFGAMIGGLAYMLSGKVASLVSPGHDGKMYVSALLPLVLWAVLRGMRDGRVWAWGVLALATGLCILSPHFQLTYYAGYIAGAFTLWLAFQKGEGRLEPRTRWIRLGFATASAILGVGVASIALMPAMEYLAFSPRGGGGRGYEYATMFSMPPEELINGYLAEFSGILTNYWGRNNFKLHSEYLGAAVLVLAGASFGGERRRGFVLFWAIAFAVFTLWAFGGHTPFFRLIYLLPMMKVMRALDMIFFIPTFALAVLAAVGTERILLGEKSRRYFAGWAIGALVVALLASVGAFTAIGHAIAGAGKWEVVEANKASVMLGGWRSLFFVGLVAGTGFLLLRGKIAPRVAGFALAVIVALDLWSVVNRFFQWSPSGSQLYASDAAIDWLRKLEDPARVAVLALPRAPQDAPADPVLNGDGMIVHHVRTLTGHQGNEIQRWVELAGGKSPAPPQNLFSPQFRRLANVRYWYTNGELPETVPDLPGTSLRKVLGPIRNAAGNTVFLYEFAGEENPYAWIAPVIAKAPPPAILNTVLDPRFDPRRAAVFDDSADVPAVAVSALPEPSPIRARVSRLEPGSITIDLDQPATAGSALVVSENYYPGWTARVDGQPAKIGRADYTLIGVALPQGARKVELSFTEQAYARGKAITFVSLAIVTLLIAVGALLDRRRRPAPVPVAAHG